MASRVSALVGKGGLLAVESLVGELVVEFGGLDFLPSDRLVHVPLLLAVRAPVTWVARSRPTTAILAGLHEWRPVEGLVKDPVVELLGFHFLPLGVLGHVVLLSSFGRSTLPVTTIAAPHCS